MTNREFYSQKEIPREEIERLKKIEYPNFVSETLLNNIDLEGKKVLDAGAGPNTKLAEFVSRKKGIYVPLDLRADVLNDMKSKLENAGLPFNGVRGDVKALPFADRSFNFIHQRFVLMNIVPETRKQVLKEALRVGKENIFLLEYNWRTLKSTESSEIIERFRDLAFQMFAKFQADPYMGEKFGELFNDVDSNLDYSLQSFRREEDTANTPELILMLRGLHQSAKNLLKDENLAGEFVQLIEELEKSPIKFMPPEIVAATIKIQK